MCIRDRFGAAHCSLSLVAQPANRLADWPSTSSALRAGRYNWNGDRPPALPCANWRLFSANWRCDGGSPTLPSPLDVVARHSIFSEGGVLTTSATRLSEVCMFCHG